jgi:hypothetical protein
MARLLDFFDECDWTSVYMRRLYPRRKGLPRRRVDGTVNTRYTKGMAKRPGDDPAMARVRTLFEKSGLSLHDLGLKMGYAEGIARQSAFQFMKSNDPRISMLRRFAKALGIDLVELTGGK